MADSYIDEFERALRGFVTRFGQEKASVMGVSGRLVTLRGELLEADNKVKAAREELGKVLATVELHKKKMETNENVLRDRLAAFEALESDRAAEYRRLKAEASRMRDEAASVLKGLQAERDTLRKQKEAMRAVVG